MKLITLPMLALASLLAFNSGCASKPTTKPGFNFSQYHTFAVLPISSRGTYQDPSLVTRLSRPVQETVVDTLTAKGFKLVPESEADFLVKMQFDYLPEQGRSEERMFDLQIVDNPTKEVVWSRSARRSTDTTLPENVIRQRIADMLKSFPPGSGH